MTEKSVMFTKTKSVTQLASNCRCHFPPQILYSAHTLAQHPDSKIARENLEVFSDAWESQINDLSILVKEVNDVCQGRGDKVVYLSLPRPGVS